MNDEVTRSTGEGSHPSIDVKPAGETQDKAGSVAGMPSKGPILRTVLGIAIEYYDFTIFAIFSPFFAAQFFSGAGSAGATLSALLVFAVGFLLRPLGALFFGWLADRRGRKLTMILAMSATAVGSLAVGLSPTSATIGFAGVIVLCVARMLQGFGHGGENAGALSYLAEVAPPKRRGQWMSLNAVALMLGVLAATLLGGVITAVFDAEETKAWAWRIPFIIGGLTGLFGLYLRRSLHESTAFTGQAAKSLSGDGGALVPTVKTPLFEGMWTHRWSALRVLAMTAGTTVAFYTWGVNAAANAITSYGAQAGVALWSALGAQLVYIIALPFWGRFSDRFGRRKNFIIFGLTSAIVSFPVLWIMGPGWWQIFLAASISLFVLSAAASVDAVFYAELFPTRVRARGFAFPYACGIAIFGGTAPLLDTWTHSIGMGWLFVVYTVVLGLGAAFAAWVGREPAGRDLRD